MNPSLFNPGDYNQIVSRIQILSPDSQNKWGKMTANEMLCHVSDPFRDVLEIRKVNPAIPGFLRPVAKLFILTKKPWKKNLQTMKMYKQGPGGGGTKPTSFDSDKKTLLDLISKFSSVDANHQFGNHGGLGKLTRDENGFLMWKHLDHHLHSFGV